MTTQEQIEAKENAIASLKQNRTGTKQQYLSALQTLENELVVLQEQKIAEDQAAALEAQQALEASVEYRTNQLNGEYDPQFQSLSSAYMAALILGDTDTMTANRSTYQALLTEYNGKLGLIV